MCIFPLGARARFDLICPVVWHRAFADEFLHRPGEAGPWQQQGAVTDGVQWIVFKYFAAMIKEILESDRCSCRKSARQAHTSCLWELGAPATIWVHGRHVHLYLAGISGQSRSAVGFDSMVECIASPVVTEDWGFLEGLCVDTSMTRLYHFHTPHSRTGHACWYRPKRKHNTVGVRLDWESIPI